MALSNGHDVPKAPNVTSLDEARKRAEAKAKAGRRAVRSAGGARPVRDYVYGGLMIAMALGTVVWFVMRVMPAGGP